MTWLRTAVFNERPELDEAIAEGLNDSDCRMMARYSDLDNMAERLAKLDADVAIMVLKALDSARVEQLKSVIADNELPVALFADDADPGIIVKLVKADVGAYVYDGFSPERFRAVVAVAVARYVEMRKLRQTADDATRKLEERKAVERAKGLLMSHHKMSEDDAYKTLRQLAMNRGQRIVDTAHNTIDMLEMVGKGASR
ncbi:response regulator NasT [gamma proteobacterium HTCC5015]|nr:response regulator NasT [gamma proteobacterium HTCC5015]